MESRLHLQDADEWFYQSFTRYKNLYMFEFEAPVDTMDLIDDTSLCVAGIQAYSKKCEILQMGIPPKLLPKDMEEGLCKDRDFKIISGGYSTSRILQLKPFPSEKIVAAVQVDQSGVGLFHLGDESHGVITEVDRLNLPSEIVTPSELSKIPGVIATKGKDVILGRGHSDGVVVCRWSLDSKDKAMMYKLSSNSATTRTEGDEIDKIDFWDTNTIVFCTQKGIVYFHDVRETTDKPSAVIHSSRKINPLVVASSTNQTDNQQSTPMPPNPNPADNRIIYSFDTKPQENIVGIADSCGGLEMFDSRKPSENLTRGILPGCGSSSVLKGKFNLQFQKLPSTSDQDIKCIVTGFKDENVPVYKICKTGDILPIFTHDGHTKTVTNALWHAISDDLVFSTSIDSVLHAWQFNPENLVPT